MALYKSKQVTARAQAVSPSESNQVLAITAEYVTPTGGLASGAIIEMGAIPANCVPVDLVVQTGILGTAVTLDAGILSGNYLANTDASTMGSEFIAAGAAATAVVLRQAKSTTDLAPSTADKSWGLKVGGATTSAGIVVRATLFVAPAPLAMASV